jgi:membrane protease YdiL (CAAX protease family)
LGEELLFRWAIQGGLAAWFDSPSGQVLAVVIAAVLFGLCHFLNLAYAAVTFVIGIYFGGLMSWSGTWLAPALTHAAYDFLALVYLTRWPR